MQKKSRRCKKQKKQQERDQSLQFSEEDDKLLLQCVIIEGTRFKRIHEKYFPQKSYNAIKNRYYKHIRFQKDTLVPTLQLDNSVHLKQFQNKLEPEVQQVMNTFLDSFTTMIQKMIYIQQ